MTRGVEEEDQDSKPAEVETYVLAARDRAFASFLVRPYFCILFNELEAAPSTIEPYRCQLPE